MSAGELSKMIVWATVVWVILVSYPRRTIAEGEFLTFDNCVASFAGPVCAAAAATGSKTAIMKFFLSRITILCPSNF